MIMQANKLKDQYKYEGYVFVASDKFKLWNLNTQKDAVRKFITDKYVQENKDCIMNRSKIHAVAKKCLLERK